MKIIDKEKIKVVSENYSGNRSSETGQIDFKAGVEFAENELINLAIEFRKWPYYYNFDSVEKNFEKFIQQRNGESE